MMADFSTVCVFLSLLLSFCPQRGCCQDYQLIDLRSPGVTCSMDSIYAHLGYGTSPNCTGAINGNTTAKWSPTKYQNPNCVYTNEGAGEHYWQVDMGKTHNIHKIAIYPETTWSYMSGITVSVDNTQVFQFTSSPDYPQVITPDSPLMGRVIKLSKSGFVTLCELQVYECVSDRYGARCEETCGAGCRSDTCDSITGDCTCRTGWSPPQCQECVAGRYGTNCQQSCGAGCSTTTCDKDSGTCTCRTGWATPRCKVCVAGRYGANCQQSCGAGCSTTTCDKDSGTCTCTTGWATPRCNDCLPGHYSPNLGCKACGAGCEDVTSCDPLTGLCSCQRGWEPPTCHVCKTKLWGDHCNLTCDDCAGDGSCDRANGVCYFGSPSGQSDSDTNTGAIVGAVVGAAVFLGICVVIGALLIRSRRSQRRPTSDDVSGTSNTKSQDRERKTDFSQADTETSMSEEATAPDNYDMLRSYENSDDIKPYTSLQTNQSSTHGPHTLTTTPSDTHVYELTDADYENNK